MQFKSIISVLAFAGLSMATGGADEGDITTTSTQTLTKTVTITECNPTATNCPGRSTSTTTSTTTTTWASFPLSNSTSTAGPTASSSFVIPSSAYTTPTPGTGGDGSEGGESPSQTTGAGSEPSTAAAGGLFVQPVMLLGVLGAGAALFA
jgi:hypothetical protein